MCSVACLRKPFRLEVSVNHALKCRYDFPSRLVACQTIISLIQQYPDMDIVVGIDSLGKGDIITEPLMGAS